MSKYKKLVETVNENIESSYKFNEETARLMLSLEDEEVTKNMTLEDWENVRKICQTSKSIELSVAVLMCEDVPQYIRLEVYKMLPPENKFEALKSDYINEDIYGDIIEYFFDYDNEFFDIVKFEGHTFSNKVINTLCEEDSRFLNFLDYMPFGLIRNDDMNPLIEEMLSGENNEYFFGDVNIPEAFTSTIILNRYLSDEIKEKAFECGYDPEYLMREFTYNDRLSDKMATEIYRACADYIFDVEHDSKSEYDDADSIICKLINMKSLPLPCQVDFVYRQRYQPKLETRALPILLASENASSAIMRDALKINQKKINEMVIVNKGKINEETLDELSRSIPPMNMIPTFMWSTTNFKINDIVAQKFIKTIDESAHRIALSSIFSERKTDDAIIRKCKNVQWKEEYSFIRDLKTAVKKSIYKENQKAIMMFALDAIVDKNSPNMRYSSLQTNIAKAMFDIINEHKFDWLLTSNEELRELKTELKNLTKQYPEYKDITDHLLERAQENNKLYSILVKYPKLFSIKDPSHFSFSAVDKFDNKELYELSEKELSEFEKDVKNINNSFLNDKIKTEIEDYLEWNIYNFQHKTSIGIYKFADLYNTVTELQNKKDMSKNISEKEEVEFGR